MTVSHIQKHKKLYAWVLLTLIALVPLAAFAQQEVLLTGQDESGNTRIVRVDTSGKIVTSGTSSTSSVTSGASLYNPTATSTVLAAQGTGCTVIGGAACSTVLAAMDMQSWSRITITVTTTALLSDVVIGWSPDGSNWEAWDTTTFDEQAASTTKSLALGENSRRYLRIDARAVSGATVTVTITASQG